MSLENRIEGLRRRLAEGQFQSEAAVREAIVLPILQDLGWDIYDPTSVVREFNLGPRKVDYALSAIPPRKHVFIEVKAVGNCASGDRQLFEYAFHEGIPFAVLTDGREWNFFLPGEQGSYDERRVQKLDIIDRSPIDATATLRKYLEFKRVQSGDALAAARSDYQSISRRRDAANNIPKAWDEIISEPDSLLIDLLAEKTESLCGYRPAPEDVEAFLLNDFRAADETIERRLKPVKAIDVNNRTSPVTPVSERGIHYSIFGQHRNASSAIDALMEILRALHNRDMNFLSKLAPLVQGRTRNHLARSRADVYPQKAELSEYTTELVPGWWLGTNISNRDKLKIVKQACKAADITFGRDISIELPNT